jgi:hypothetical protein
MDNVVIASYPDVLRAAGSHQTETGLLWIPPKMRTWRMEGSTTGSGSYIEQIGGGKIQSFELHNRSAAASAVGIGFRWQNKYWRAGTLTAADVFVDASTALQSRTATAVEVAGADQSTFCVMSKRKFDWVSVDVTAAETDNDAGGEITHTAQYSTATAATWANVVAGSMLLSVAGSMLVDAAGQEWDVAVHDFAWQPPANWGLSNALSASIPDGYYVLAFRVAGREANDVAAVVTGIEIGTMLSIDQLAANAVYANERCGFVDPWANGLVALFSIADGGNRVYAETYAVG